jgi:integrase
MTTRRRGTGHLYVTHGSYYGRWRTLDGRNLNRLVGPVRQVGSATGLTRAQAERAFRRIQEAEDRAPRPSRDAATPALDAIVDGLRMKLQVQGARRSYLQNCESMQRVHISPRLGKMAITDVTAAHVEALGARMLRAGSSPKTVRNVITFLHAAFEHALERRLVAENPVRRVARPGRRRQGDVNPDLQFLSVADLEAVIRAIPDDILVRQTKPSRKGRAGPAPPPPPDVLGPVLRVIVLTAAMTGLRQSELLGLRWRDVDWDAQRIRVRNTFVRGEHSTDGKSDRSTRRSVPMADRLDRELRRWQGRTLYASEDDLVFAHPQTSRPLDRSKLTRRFQKACSDAGVRPVRFHDLRHTFATRLAASGEPLRTIQEFLGHADAKTTQIYAHYAPSRHEVEMVNRAFAATTTNGRGKEDVSGPAEANPREQAAQTERVFVERTVEGAERNRE